MQKPRKSREDHEDEGHLLFLWSNTKAFKERSAEDSIVQIGFSSFRVQ